MLGSLLTVRYLGIPLGANPRGEETWELVIDKIQKKLNGWKGKLLSRVGQHTLIKSVLNNFLMYYLASLKCQRWPKRSFQFRPNSFGVPKRVVD